jgi:ribose/xylose/arabinose/galactoside ABC-type transport system permease subunit
MAMAEMSITENDRKGRVSTYIRRYGVLIALALVFIGFGLVEPAYYSFENILTIIRQASIVGILAIGLTTVIIAGEFDMSFGAVASLTGCLSVFLMGRYHLPSIPAWLIALVAGVAVGAINGTIIVYLGVPSIIETIGMMTVLAGVTKFITKGATLYYATFPDLFPILGRAFVFKIVPTPVIIFILVIIVFVVLLEHTKKGRYLHASGGNPIAATHVGIVVKRIKFQSLIISSLTGSLGGIMIGSLLGSAVPGMGEGNLIPGISAMFLGAVFLRDGMPNIWGTVVGALLLAVLENGFVMVNMPFFMKEIVLGAVLVISVTIVAALKKGTIPGVKLI